MCPAKTENLALNVPRAEAVFWRRLAYDTGASRGALQKHLLELGLKRFNKAAARQLAAVRREFGARRFAAGAALLLIGGACLFLDGIHHGQARRAPGRTTITRLVRPEEVV